MSFRKDFLSGVLYTSVAKYAGIIISMLVTFVLARILDPSDFAVIAIAIVILNFLNLFTDFGLGPAIIQNDDLSEIDIKSLFNFTILLGIAGGIFLLLASVPIAHYYENDQLINVVRLLSINIFFISFNTVPNALLIKKKQFRLIALRTLGFQLAAGIIAIIGALKGMGVYSLVVQYMVANVGVALFNYYCNPIPFSLTLKTSSIKKIFNFSIFQFLSSIIYFFSKEIDKLIIGKKFEFDELGYYEKSYRLIQMPVNNLVAIFTPVVQPLFKDLKQDKNDFESKFFTLTRYLSLFAFPLATLLFFSGGDIIYLFYGPKWGPAIMPFKMLSIAVGFQIIMSTYMPIMQASGKVKIMLLASIIDFCLIITYLSIGLYIGELVCVALLVSMSAISFFIVYTFLIGRFVIGCSVIKLFKNTLYGVLIALICAFPQIIVNRLIIGDFSIWRLIINVLLVIGVFFLSTSWFKMISWKGLLAVFKRNK